MADIEAETLPPAFLFVYGTLKRTAAGRVHPLLKTRAEFFGCATVYGKIYQRDGYPGLVPDPGPQAVRGELYRVLDAKNLFKRLDLYEGCTAETAKTAEFLRASVEVETDRGKKLKAWAYLLTEKPEERFLISEGVFKV